MGRRHVRHRGRIPKRGLTDIDPAEGGHPEDPSGRYGGTRPEIPSRQRRNRSIRSGRPVLRGCQKSPDSSGKNYEISIPYDRDIPFTVRAIGVHLVDGNNAALDQGQSMVLRQDTKGRPLPVLNYRIPDPSNRADGAFHDSSKRLTAVVCGHARAVWADGYRGRVSVCRLIAGTGKA